VNARAHFRMVLFLYGSLLNPKDMKQSLGADCSREIDSL
jgi:hypothetical protein